jgi:hypothetical protein
MTAVVDLPPVPSLTAGMFADTLFKTCKYAYSSELRYADMLYLYYMFRRDVSWKTLFAESSEDSSSGMQFGAFRAEYGNPN